MHRNLISTVGACVLLAFGLAPAEARQDATPMSGLADLGLPELNITVTTTNYEGIPESLEAGRYLVSVTAGEGAEEGGGVGFVQPVGMTPEEFLSGLMAPDDISGVEATPELSMDATPSEGGEEFGGAPPPEYYQSVFAGGTYAPPGETRQIVLDLTPGEWIAWGDDPEAAQEAVIFEVTGEMPAELPEPESSATITMAEYSFTVTEGELIAGEQLIKIENVGAQPHFVIMAKGPVDMTQEDIGAILEADMTGTPAAVGIDPDTDLVDLFFTGTQSRGTATWVPVNVEPGTYVLVCFFPDMGDGLPHAYKGMYSIVEVAA